MFPIKHNCLVFHIQLVPKVCSNIQWGEVRWLWRKVHGMTVTGTAPWQTFSLTMSHFWRSVTSDAFTYPLIIFRFRRQYYKCCLRHLDPYVLLTLNIKNNHCWHRFRLLAHFELFHRSTYLFLHCFLSVPVCHSDHICSSCWLEEESETTQFRIKKWEYN